MYSLHIENLAAVKNAAVAGRPVPSHYEVHFDPQPDERRPGLVLSIDVVDGIPQCSEVRVRRSDHGREVLKIDLEDVVIEDWIEVATEYISQVFDRSEYDEGDGRTVFHYKHPDDADYKRAVRKVRTSARRRGPTDQTLLEALNLYEAADHAPTQAVADHYDIKHRTASLWVSRAKKLRGTP